MPKISWFKTSRSAKPCSHFCIKSMPHWFESHSYHQHKRGLVKAPTTKTEMFGRCIKACNTESSYHKHLYAVLPTLFSLTNNMNFSTTDISNMHQSDVPPSIIRVFTISQFIQNDFTISPFHHFVVTQFHHFAISPFCRHTILPFHNSVDLFSYDSAEATVL